MVEANLRLVVSIANAHYDRRDRGNVDRPRFDGRLESRQSTMNMLLGMADSNSAAPDSQVGFSGVTVELVGWGIGGSRQLERAHLLFGVWGSWLRSCAASRCQKAKRPWFRSRAARQGRAKRAAKRRPLTGRGREATPFCRVVSVVGVGRRASEGRRTRRPAIGWVLGGSAGREAAHLPSRLG